MDKRSFTERDICTKFIMPALKSAGWDEMLQVREEVYFTNGPIIVRGKLVSRGKAKKADWRALPPSLHGAPFWDARQQNPGRFKQITS
jgi:type I site-specific restriction endonuclease